MRQRKCETYELNSRDFSEGTSVSLVSWTFYFLLPPTGASNMVGEILWRIVNSLWPQVGYQSHRHPSNSNICIALYICYLSKTSTAVPSFKKNLTLNCHLFFLWGFLPIDTSSEKGFFSGSEVRGSYAFVLKMGHRERFWFPFLACHLEAMGGKPARTFYVLSSWRSYSLEL